MSIIQRALYLLLVSAVSMLMCYFYNLTQSEPHCRSDRGSYPTSPLSPSSTQSAWSEKWKRFTLPPSTLPPLSTSFHLWSQKPETVHWNGILEMCKPILSPRPSQEALTRARNWTIPLGHTDQSIAQLLSNCTRFRHAVPFAQYPESEEEAEFPLAYVVIGARNAAQLVRLFRMIYQPQNAYCFTYDNKSGQDFKETIQSLVKCFQKDENVFLAPEVEVIEWGKIAILRSVLRCMRVLLDRSRAIPWRYIQVVSWNDFPLKTNAEMVKIFKIFNGSQDCELERIQTGFFVPYVKQVIPDGLTLYKGSFAASMTREFIDFLFTDQSSQRLLKWLEGTHCPEEHFWQTVIHNQHLNAPGSFPGQCLHTYLHKSTRKAFISRYQVWNVDNVWYPVNVCNGKFTASSCVFGVGDVQYLVENPALMAHKVYEEFQPATQFCLEQWFWNRSTRKPINVTFYENLPPMRYARLEDKNNFTC